MMDSKGFSPSSDNDEAAPPSYSETISSKFTSASSTSHSYSSQIQSQLHSLTSQISCIQNQKDLLANAQDEKLLALLTTHIQQYLSDFAKTGLQRGSLILVPAKGLEEQPSALPTDFDFKNPDEYDRVVRVRDKEDDEYGNKQLWYWRDESMALRLAEYLKPIPDPQTVDLPPRREQVTTQQQAEGSSSKSWWRRKSSAKNSDRPPLVEERRDLKVDSDAKDVKKGLEDKVIMDVKAEEVVFRYENDFGILCTKRGWCLVLKLRVILAGR